MAEKITLQGPGRSDPALNEHYVSDTPQDLNIHQNAGKPKIPFSDSKIEDSFDRGDNALLLNQNEKLAPKNLDDLADEPSQSKKDDVLSTE